MKIRIYDNFSEELNFYWKSLESASLHYVFQSHEWLSHWWNAIGKFESNMTLVIVVIFDGDLQPRLLFPLVLRKKINVLILEFIGGSQTDYQGPIVHREWIKDLTKIREAWNYTLQKLPQYDVRHFMKIPEKIEGLCNPLLSIWDTKFLLNSYSAALPSNFVTFEKRLSTKLKADTRRQRKRLSGYGEIKFSVIQDNDLWMPAMDAMIAQKRDRYLSTGVLDMLKHTSICTFYRDSRLQLSNKVIPHLSTLTLNNEIIATHWGVIYQNRFYFLMPTYLSGRWSSYSPGRILLEELIKWCINYKINIFDFTIGGEDYKKDWCDSESNLFETIEAVRFKGYFYFFYIHLRRCLRSNKFLWEAVKKINRFTYIR
jgi:CelD/BcsL family acetyltransferase involved in cellulose biosynthesis